MTVTLKVPTCIMEYGSTPYIGMAREKNGRPISCVQNHVLISLVNP